MENKPFEDAFPIENGDITASYVSLPEGNIQVYSYMRGQPAIPLINIMPSNKPNKSPMKG